MIAYDQKKSNYNGVRVMEILKYLRQGLNDLVAINFLS